MTLRAIWEKVEKRLRYALGVAASLKSMANKSVTASSVEVSIPLSVPHNGTDFLSDSGKWSASGTWGEMAKNTLGTTRKKSGTLN